ncbi:MAG: hypothetical protein HC879_18075 [Leptolyngbyaceae cyanobacterium SL_5_9]|nr:hypothetical protein [Leptolyngbyaceae cyanobacterium SL_5_9]
MQLPLPRCRSLPRFQAPPGNVALEALPLAVHRGRASRTAFLAKSQERVKPSYLVASFPGSAWKCRSGGSASSRT